MILLADSGSTKTDWCIAENNSIQKRISTRGTNPFFQTPDEIEREIASELVPATADFPIDRIFFYGAGCAFPEKNEIIRAALAAHFPTAAIEINRRHAGRCKGTLSAIGRNRLHFGNRIQLLLLRRETDLQQRFAIGIHSRRRRQRSRFGPAVGGRLSEKSTALPAEGKISRTVRSDPSHYLGTRLQTPLPQPFSGQSIAVYRREPPDSRNPTYRFGRIYRLFPAQRHAIRPLC